MSQTYYIGELVLVSSGYLVYQNHSLHRLQLPTTLLNLGSNPPNSPLYIRRDGASQNLPLIAAQHCTIFYDRQYACFTIKDAFSEHGTWVNKERLDPQHARHLHDGDEIQLGDSLPQGGALLRFYFYAQATPDTESISKLPLSRR